VTAAAPESRRIGIVAAVAGEGAILRKALGAERGPTPLVAVSGMGAARAERAAEMLAERGAVGLASFGYAGALAEDLAQGTLIVADRIATLEGRNYPSDDGWAERLLAKLSGEPKARRGSLLCIHGVAAGPERKRAHRARSRALAVDMESVGVGAVAMRRGLPFLALRAIVDEAHHAVPLAARCAVDANGITRPWRIVLPLLRRPGDLPALMRLGRGARAADRALHEACRSAGPSLALF
jgi:hopanoid-associated phosphorylase